MREIKFRAWDKEAKEMVYFVYRPENCQTRIEFVSKEGEMIEEPSELMQYTGLKDKNGKEIYEGDVVNLVTKDFDYPDVVNTGKVIFEGGSWSVIGKEDDFYLYGQDEVEIIGNIYENNNLIK
jgi:uncharacterized phage protein (TIGR01671 family)